MKAFLLVFGLVASPILALDDIPVYYDAGCADVGVPKWYAGGSAELITVSVAGQETLPVSCEDKYRGTDAVRLQLTSDMGNGGYFDVIMKFADDKLKLAAGYGDVRFRVKNLRAAPARLRPVVQVKTNWSNKPAEVVTVDASAEWVEMVVPLSSFSGLLAATDSVVGFGFSYSYNYGDRPAGSALDVLLDDVRFTDGTGGPLLDIPEAPGGALPTGWPNHLLVGSMDVREDRLTSAQVQAGEYRYQYIMPETFTQWNANYAYNYAVRSQEIGMRSGFVWYNLGKVSEALVAENLNTASFMEDYVTRYEEFLRQLAEADQEHTIIVLEPDMYGKLMQDGQLPTMNCAEVPVNMTRANAVSGGTHAANLCGWAEYVVSRARQRLPKGVIIGHMLNHWGVNIPGQIGQGRVEAHIMGGYAQGNFISSLGPVGKGDVVFVEKTDRDAGTKPTNENWFWTDENYAKYFGWVKCLSSRSGLRVVGWQVSEGNSAHPSPANRDDAPQYFVDHPELWAQAGFIGVLFGAGMDGQANYATSPVRGDDNDGGWFLNTIAQYYSAGPYSLTEIQTPLKGGAHFRAVPRPAGLHFDLVGRRQGPMRNSAEP